MYHRNNSFTLIEILLALFITAILVTILSVVFNTGLRAYRQGKDLLEITRKGQLILGQMTRELAGAMVQSSGGTTYIPFEGTGNYVCFMAPVENSSPVDLCEIGYIRDSANTKLDRHFYTANASTSNYEYPGQVDYDKDTNGIPAGMEFCNNVSNFNLRYHDETSWIAAGSTWSSNNKLPTMVEVSVTIQGEYPRTGPQQSKTFTTWIYLPNSTNNP